LAWWSTYNSPRAICGRFSLDAHFSFCLSASYLGHLFVLVT
jgi:hypothetical protein